MSIVQCPECLSENVSLLSYGLDEFICNDCGEDFTADNGYEEDELMVDY